MRDRRVRAKVFDALAEAQDRLGMRVVHFSIQDTHIHWIVEAEGGKALSRGMQGLLVRIARGLNKLWGRGGTVFPDRFHHRVLGTPREVRNALVYVLQNGVKHGCVRLGWVDPFGSGRWFGGWREEVADSGWMRPVAGALTWLLRVGWLRGGGPISLLARPAL